MPSLRTLIPDESTVISMATSDLAGYVLESLFSMSSDERGNWNRTNFCMSAAQAYAVPGESPNIAIGVACSSAWSWLEANGMICKHPEQSSDWYFPTPTGARLRTHQGLKQVLQEQSLPADFLHPDLLANARPLYFQSRFETAVFESFKALEIAIRSAAGLGHDSLGVQLASKAFHPDTGPLTDLTSERGERVALMSLMTGALGSYKNPSSHQRVELSSEEAREMIMLASHLLKVVDARAR